jgi:hypothetical protein
MVPSETDRGRSRLSPVHSGALSLKFRLLHPQVRLKRPYLKLTTVTGTGRKESYVRLWGWNSLHGNTSMPASEQECRECTLSRTISQNQKQSFW